MFKQKNRRYFNEKLASNKPESTTPEAPKQLPGDDEAKNGQVQAEGEKNAK